VEGVARTFEDAKDMMNREFNSLSRQNRILGIITALRFENVLATNQNDLGRALYAFSAKLEN
jgi:hypothetical protein